MEVFKVYSAQGIAFMACKFIGLVLPTSGSQRFSQQSFSRGELYLAFCYVAKSQDMLVIGDVRPTARHYLEIAGCFVGWIVRKSCLNHR